MAFPSAAGHTNLPNGNFSPVIYSRKVLLSLKKKSIAEAITNTDFEGDIKAFGDSVRIIKQPIVTVSDYTRGKTMTSQALLDEDITMTIDQAKAYQFYMDDIELAHEHVSFEDMAADSGSYSLKDAFDSNVITAINAGVSSTNALGSITVGFGSGIPTPRLILCHAWPVCWMIRIFLMNSAGLLHRLLSTKRCAGKIAS